MQDELGIKSSQLFFKNKAQNFKDIDVIEMTFKDGKRTKLRLVDLNTEVQLEGSKFNFVIPSNTKKN